MRRGGWAAAALLLVACGRGSPSRESGFTRLAAPPARPQLMFVSVASDDTFHKVSIAPLGSLDRGAYITPLTCDRVYFGGSRGICLASEVVGRETQWFADVFDDRFARLHRIPLDGLPSRVRLSPDGRRAAVTMFENGHSYAENGFSTRTTLIDTAAGAAVGDLEQFTTVRDNRIMWAEDFNFWGVTFTRDSDTFYATLDTAGASSLVKGSVGGWTVEVLRPGVECPSVSPDNARLAFKKRIGTRSRGWWQIAVLSLDTMKETLVATETRSVDDQVEWIDDERVAYHLTGGSTAADLWSVRIDGSEAPKKLLGSAYSPAVVR